MQAMVLETARAPLRMRERPMPVPAAREILLEVAACGVCRTDLHVVDGELPHPKLPLIPGHEIVGRVAALGADVAGLAVAERIGVPWLGYTCGVCPYCRAGRENLCDRPLFTGYTRDGGYATHALADARFCFPLPERRDDAEIAPFLCAGLIGWRSYRMAGAHGDGQSALSPRGQAWMRLASTASARPRTFLRKSRPGKAAASMPSPAAATRRRKRLQSRSERSGPGAQMKCHPNPSTPPSSLPRSARSFHWRSRR